jgi:hypothetical protein
MSGVRHDGRRRSSGSAMVRGIVLVLVAVGLGVVLLNAEPYDPDTVDAAGEVTTTTAGGRDDPVLTPLPSDDDVPDDDVPDPRDPGEYTILVANGSGVGGAAGRATDQAVSAGFQAATPTDADQRVDASVVYHAEGFAFEAAELAAVFDPTPEVQPLPDPPPVPDLAGADVVLVVGPDLAATQ